MSKQTQDMTVKDSTPENASYQAWLAVVAMALAVFTVVSAEMLPIGLLTPIAESLSQSVGLTSLIISTPSFVAAITAPCVVLIFNRINRRKLLLLFMLLLLLANIAAALVTNFYGLLLARVLFGISMGGIWSLAGSMAARLVPSHQASLAASIIFSGIAAASVLGIPLGVFLGDAYGWRMVFICVAILTTAVAGLMFFSLPSLVAREGSSWSQASSIFKQKNIWIGMAATLFIVVGHFSAYTFIRPLLQDIAQFADQSIGTLLLAFGVFGIIGNFICGFSLNKYLWQTIFGIATLLTISIVTFLAIGHSQIMSSALLMLWGLAYGGVSVSVTTWMIRAAPQHIEISTASNTAIFNLSIGTGALIGGLSYDHFGILHNIVLASLFTALAAGLILYSVKAAVVPKNLGS